jgi:hypothetical protein
LRDISNDRNSRPVHHKLLGDLTDNVGA